MPYFTGFISRLRRYLTLRFRKNAALSRGFAAWRPREAASGQVFSRADSLIAVEENFQNGRDN